MTYSWENICFALDIHLLAPSPALLWLYIKTAEAALLTDSDYFHISILSSILVQMFSYFPDLAYRQIDIGYTHKGLFFIADKPVWRTFAKSQTKCHISHISHTKRAFPHSHSNLIIIRRIPILRRCCIEYCWVIKKFHPYFEKQFRV